MSRSLQIFLVCAAGACIGTLVSLQTWGSWALGCLVGATLGYVCIDLRGVTRALQYAWANTRFWESIKKCCNGIAYGVALLATGFAIVVTFFYTLALCIFLGGGEGPFAWPHTFAFNFGDPVQYGLVFFVLGLSSAAAAIVAGYVTHRQRAFSKESWALIGTLFFKYNPYGFFCYTAPKYTIVGTIAFCSVSRELASSSWHFIILFVRYIHSDIRVLCAIDAAIGAGIGYAAGNVLLGTFAGGILGFLNYEIISKRVLKLVPEKM